MERQRTAGRAWTGSGLQAQVCEWQEWINGFVYTFQTCRGFFFSFLLFPLESHLTLSNASSLSPATFGPLSISLNLIFALPLGSSILSIPLPMDYPSSTSDMSCSFLTLSTSQREPQHLHFCYLLSLCLKPNIAGFTTVLYAFPFSLILLSHLTLCYTHSDILPQDSSLIFHIRCCSGPVTLNPFRFGI